MDRRNLILSGILVVQIVLIAFFFWPQERSNAAVSTLLENLSEGSLSSVVVESPTERIELSKTDDGWVASNYGDYPVDSLKISELISKVVDIDTSRLVAQTSSSHNQLRVSDREFAKKLTFTATDGRSQTLYIGTSPSVRTTNVRLDGQEQVYLTSEVTGSEIRTDVGGWIALTYLQVPTADIQAVTIENANGTLEFTRVNTTTWTLANLDEDETFNNNNFSTILTRLGTFNMIAPVSKEEQPEFGMDEPNATVTIETEPAEGEAETITLVIGAKDEGGTNYYVKASNSDFYVKVASFTGDQFVNDTRDRYLQAPPTPEATTTLSETVPLTSLLEISPTETLSLTEPLIVTDSITDTDAITATEALTATEEVTTSEEITETP